MPKLKFFLIGLIPGLVIVFFILNQKGASCTGYLPNSRVIAESLSKKFEYSPEFEAQMKALNIDEKFVRDSIITPGYVDFDKGNAQQKPCALYVLTSSKSNPEFEIVYEKCQNQLKLKTLKKLR